MTRPPDSAVPAAAPAAPVPRLGSWWAVGPIVLLVVAAYLGALRGREFVFDDASSIVENQAIRRLWPLTTVLSPPADAGVGGRPLPHLSYAVNYAISGLDPWSYRALAVILHVGCALALFGLVRRTLGLPVFSSGPCTPRIHARACALALVVAVLWGVHPLTTAVVDYVSQRTEALMALCYLATLYCFVRASAPAIAVPPGSSTASSSAPSTPRRLWAVACVACCAAGMASKETMVTAPLLVLLYDRTFVGGTFHAAWRARARLHVALAATWLVLAALILSSPVAQRGVGFGLGVSAYEYAFTSAGALLRYLRLAVWPDPLVFDYGWMFVRDLRAAAPALIAGGAVVVATGFALRRRPVLGFAGAAFLLILGPTTSFYPIIQQPIAESRMYLPLAVVVVLAVLGAHRPLYARPRVSAALAIVAALVLGALTMRRHADYHTEIALWSDTVAKRPDNARAHGQLGASLLRAGRLDESLAASAAAVHLRPDYADAHNNLGIAHARAGRPSQAIEHYRRALQIDADDDRARYNLGEVLVQTGRTDEAVGAFERVLRLRPGHARAHNNLGVVLLQLGRVEEAIAHDRAALRLQPQFAEAHYNLGNALARTGDFAAALAAYEAALRETPAFARAHNNLGALLLRAGRAAEAATHFEQALRHQPDYPEAQRNLELIRPR